MVGMTNAGCNPLPLTMNRPGTAHPHFSLKDIILAFPGHNETPTENVTGDAGPASAETQTPSPRHHHPGRLR